MTHRRIKSEYNLNPVIDKSDPFSNYIVNNFWKKTEPN